MSKFRGHGTQRSPGGKAPRAARRRPKAGRMRRWWTAYGPSRRVLAVAGAVAIFVAGAMIGLTLGQHEGQRQAQEPARASVSIDQGEATYEVPVRAYRMPEPSLPGAAPLTADEPWPTDPPLPAAEPPAIAPAPQQLSIAPQDGQQASLPPPRQAWEHNAVAMRVEPGRPMIAIVIDDLGVDQAHTRQAIDLPAPLTMAFLPYGHRLREHAARAREQGHELLVHLPMEPSDPEPDPGPNALLTHLEPEELARRIEWNLEQFDGYVGLNNHMGSRFSAWEPGMRMVLQAVQSRGLLFLDSRTSPLSAGMRLARAMGLPHAGRDVFLDNVKEEAAIRAQLAEVERIAMKHGHAIGIGHPYEQTLAVLRQWIAEAQQRGFQLVPVSAIVRRRAAAG